MGGLYLPGVSVILSILLLIIYFSKKRILLSENRFYERMIIAGLIDSICVLCLQLEFYLNDIHNFTLVKLINKFDFVVLLTWISSLFIYIIIITYGENKTFKNGKKSFINIINIINLVFTFAIFVSKIDIIIESNNFSATVGGTAIYLAIIFFLLYIIFSLSIVILKVKRFDKKYAPVFAMLFIMTIIAINFIINPFFIDISFGIVLINLIMFFTIENPDVKMLEELEKNQELTEKNIEDKSNLLFKITEDVKGPISKIEKISSQSLKKNDIKELKENNERIYKLSSSVNNTINNVFDISNYDNGNVKLINLNYDLYNIFNQIVLSFKEKIEGTNIDFKYNMSSLIPNKLYGDSVKIKQVIYSILMKSLNDTKNGFVDLDISCINKDNVCRLIITISNNGKKISLKDINSILEIDEFIKIDKDKDEYFDIKIAKNTIDSLDGSLFIDCNDITSYTIILNQQIESYKSNKKENYSLSNKKCVLLIDDDYQKLQRLNIELKNNNYVVTSTMYGMDLINKIKNGEQYDLIFIDDEMKPYSAVEVIKKINNKDLKIIIMLEKDKEFIKDNYLKDYNFVDYLLKDNYKEEIKRIKEKY